MIDNIIKAVVATFTMGSKKPSGINMAMKSVKQIMLVALLL